MFSQVVDEWGKCVVLLAYMFLLRLLGFGLVVTGDCLASRISIATRMAIFCRAYTAAGAFGGVIT